jgi:acetyltransferase
MSTHKMERLFNPKSVAVIGASNKKGSVGYILIHNLIAAEYNGVIYPVNPKLRAVQGIHSFATVAQVPRKVDLAIIAVPAPGVSEVVRECGEAGVGACVIVSAGFKETGAEGRRRENEVLTIAQSYDLRVLGPNCLGYLRPGKNINATFAHVMPEQGRIAFISQSGALGAAVLEWAIVNHVGFSAFVSVGSMADVDFGDLIDYFGADAQTNSIILYIESITDTRKFMSAARHFAKSKPIIVVKTGHTPRAAMAASWHTGAAAGDDRLYSAAFRRAGIVRVDEIEDLFDASEALSRVSSPRGPRLGIVTNAGGPAVMATDRLLDLGGMLAELTPETDAKLKAALPAFATRGNPVDLGGDADEGRYAAAAAALMDDPNVDGVLAILTPQAMTHPAETGQALLEVSRRHAKKPLLTSFMGVISSAPAAEFLRVNNIPTFGTPDDAVRAYMYMCQYTRNLQLLYETPKDILPDFHPNRAKVKGIFNELARSGSSKLTEAEAREVLESYRIPTIKTLVAASPQEAVKQAEQLGFPVVLKILTRDARHKSDCGGVALNIRSGAEVAKQYQAILERAQAVVPKVEILGMAVEQMAPRDGYEVVIGARRDATFGPTMVFGVGGAGFEVYRDVALDFPPLNETLARAMIRDTKISRLLEGRGDGPAIDMVALEQALEKFSYLLVDFPEIRDIDVSPVYVRPDGLTTLGASITIDPADVHKIAAADSHLIISMYPSKYESVHSVEGQEEPITLRPIRPEDEPLWAEMITSLSEATVEYRFFGPVKQITKSMMVRYCHIDYDREIAIVAVQGEKKKARMLGVARLTKETGNPGEGEFAIVVRDELQGSGIGKQLMDALIFAARDMHIREIWGDVLAGNAPMLRFAESLGFEVRGSEDPDIRKIVLTVWKGGHMSPVA